MREQFIIGNWKMHGTKAFVSSLLNKLKNSLSHESNVKMAVCPPYVFLQQTQLLLQDSKLAWGAQNMAVAEKGPYTGEISANMLVEFACRYVLLGHSERRTLYGETDEQIAQKFKRAIHSGLIPILCVGETLTERQADQTTAVLVTQLKNILDLGSDLLKKAIIAYEPVWAIGTGLSAQPQQAQEVHQFLRQQLRSLDSDLAQKLPILYGGSVNVNNAKALFEMPDIDGGLIGGASLVAEEFLDIYRILVSIVG